MKDGRRSDNIYRLRLGRLQRDSKIIKCKRNIARQPRSESVHAQAKCHCEEELYAAALATSESKGIVSLLNDLGYWMKPVLAIDTKATEHIPHRQGIGKLKHIDVPILVDTR